MNAAFTYTIFGSRSRSSSSNRTYSTTTNDNSITDLSGIETGDGAGFNIVKGDGNTTTDHGAVQGSLRFAKHSLDVGAKSLGLGAALAKTGTTGALGAVASFGATALDAVSDASTSSSEKVTKFFVMALAAVGVAYFIWGKR